MANATKKVGMEEYVENFLAENSALRRKLQSKAEALLILSKELNQSRIERDQYKLMAEQLQDRYTTLKKKSLDLGLSRSSLYGDIDGYENGDTILQILSETREKNKAMKIEVEDLRQKLRDAQGDIKVLRMHLNQKEKANINCENPSFPSHQKEELVQQLETMNIKCTQMEVDLQSVLDEKEELVTERDAYKCKVHRLNHELNNLLKGNGKKLIDVDGLVMENRYLQDRLQQAQEEKDMIHQALSKYKNMLEKKRSKGTIKLGTNNGSGMVMTHRQVQQLLEHGTSAQLPNTAATLADMKSLCLALLEALSDKSLALSHQKKANRILARRISELEDRLHTAQGNCVPIQTLLEGYSSSGVDRDASHILAAEEDDTDSEGETVSSLSSRKNSENSLQRIDTEKNQRKETSVEVQRESSEPVITVHSTQSQNVFQGSSELTEKLLNMREKSINAEDYVLRYTPPLPPQLQLLVQKALDEITD